MGPYNLSPSARDCKGPYNTSAHVVNITCLRIFYLHLEQRKIQISLQSWPKISGQIPKLNTKYLPAPMQCCQVAVFMYSPIDFSGFQHCLGEGGLPKIRNDGTTKLMMTGYFDIQNTNVHCKRYFRICPRKYWPGL